MLKFPFLAVDPGLNELGWALWTGESRRWCGDGPPPVPCSCGVIKLPREYRRLRPMDKAKPITDELKRAVDLELECYGSATVRSVAVEIAEVRGSAVGAAAAARGDVVALALQAGMVLHAWEAAVVRALTVSEWKGQLPKEVVEARLNTAGVLDMRQGGRAKSHAVDAVGIGVVAMGYRLDDARWFNPRRGGR